MRVLIATLIQRDANGVPFVFQRAMQSLYNLRFKGQVDYYAPSGMDTNQANKSINAKYQQVRQLTLDGSYDALLTVESDMIIPPDALEKLADLETDCAYGLYLFRHGRYDLNASLDLTVGKNTPLNSKPEYARQIWGQVIEVAGIGLGCTLIRRHVLEAVPFDCREHGHTDWQFAQNVRYAGGEQLCHTGVVCGHINKNKVLWPDMSSEELYREEPL